MRSDELLDQAEAEHGSLTADLTSAHNTKDRSGQTLVLIEEEYGYRYGYLYTDSTPEELVTWWQGLQSAPAGIGRDSGQFRWHGLEGDLEVCQSYADETEWQELHTAGEHPYVHFHMEFDSYLEVNGQVVHHAGYQDDWPASEEEPAKTAFEISMERVSKDYRDYSTTKGQYKGTEVVWHRVGHNASHDFEVAQWGDKYLVRAHDGCPCRCESLDGTIDEEHPGMIPGDKPGTCARCGFDPESITERDSLRGAYLGHF